MSHPVPAVVVQGTPAPDSRSSSIEQFTGTTDLYPLARGLFAGFPVPYLLQGANGPCPLLAICNVLLFNGVLTLPEDMTQVSFEALIEELGNLIVDKNKAAEEDGPLRDSLNKSVSLLGSLNKGLTVNVKFTSIYGFEYTEEMSVFEMLDVHVYHGWLVSEDDMASFPYISPLSYNEAIEKVTECEEIKARVLESGEPDQFADKKELLQEGEAIATWLDHTSNQLTSDGIISLNSHMSNGDLAVLFRNNHFSVIHKWENRLFSLVTDIGFRRTGIMWESLDQLDGDTTYFNAKFEVLNGLAPAPPIESDYQMALRLQNEQQQRLAPVVAGRYVQSGATVVGEPVRSTRRKKKCTIM